MPGTDADRLGTFGHRVVVKRATSIGHMFVTHAVRVDLPFTQASARLENLIGGGGLDGPSNAAYRDGLETQIRVGPLPDVLGKMVRVRFLEPAYSGGSMRVGLRWEATGLASGLFPVLDADMTLSAAGDEVSTLELAGAYRPPLGRLGEGLDRAVLNRVAAATVRDLLERVSDLLAHPAVEGRFEPYQQEAPRPAADSGSA